MNEKTPNSQTRAAMTEARAMTRARDFKETVTARVQSDPAFAQALLDEAITLFTNGEPGSAKLMLPLSTHPWCGARSLRVAGTARRDGCPVSCSTHVRCRRGPSRCAPRAARRKWQHVIVEHMHGGQLHLAGVQPSEGIAAVAVDDRLHVRLAYALERADEGDQLSGAMHLDLALPESGLNRSSKRTCSSRNSSLRSFCSRFRRRRRSWQRQLLRHPQRAMRRVL